MSASRAILIVDGKLEHQAITAELRRCLEFEAERAGGLLTSGRAFRERVPGRIGRAVWLFARGGLAALAALERADWDIYGGRPRPSRARLALEALRT